MNMFNRQEWSQVLIPKTTKEGICKTAKAHNLKIWEVVDNSFQVFNHRLNNETEYFNLESRLERIEKDLEIIQEQLSEVPKKKDSPGRIRIGVFGSKGRKD